jgi:hypothetical protein
VARQFHFDPGTIVVDDRAYNNYALCLVDGSPKGSTWSPG